MIQKKPRGSRFERVLLGSIVKNREAILNK